MAPGGARTVQAEFHCAISMQATLRTCALVRAAQGLVSHGVRGVTRWLTSRFLRSICLSINELQRWTCEPSAPSRSVAHKSDNAPDNRVNRANDAVMEERSFLRQRFTQCFQVACQPSRIGLGEDQHIAAV